MSEQTIRAFLNITTNIATYSSSCPSRVSLRSFSWLITTGNHTSFICNLKLIANMCRNFLDSPNDALRYIMTYLIRRLLYCQITRQSSATPTSERTVLDTYNIPIKLFFLPIHFVCTPFNGQNKSRPRKFFDSLYIPSGIDCLFIYWCRVFIFLCILVLYFLTTKL